MLWKIALGTYKEGKEKSRGAHWDAVLSKDKTEITIRFDKNMHRQTTLEVEIGRGEIHSSTRLLSPRQD